MRYRILREEIKMFELKGKHSSALIYAKAVDINCENQILQYLNDPISAGVKVRIMPDVHLGNGATIGFTATCNEYVTPSIVGVDIGCGVNAYNLGKCSISFDKLDKFIRKNIPSGREVNNSPLTIINRVYDQLSINELKFKKFENQVDTITQKLEIDNGRVWMSLGSLGGGNHFIEIDKDKNKNHWLLIHSGSRCFGLFISNYYQKMANKRCQSKDSIKYLINQAAMNYSEDMKIAQIYARLNRDIMAYLIINEFFKLDFSKIQKIESVHNYIDFEHGIVRKGAISAQKGEQVVIPFSMADGAIIGIGKGNSEWNYSAPHGSGRKVSRTQAKSLSMSEYRKQMKNIWSSSINESTLDESPMAYKSTKDILSYLPETVHITHRLTPVYNFKAEE